MNKSINRRTVIAAGGIIGAAVLTGAWTKSRRVPFGTPPSSMKAGDYAWAPENAPEGTIVVIVSLPEQHAYVYRGGTLIAVSTCSTGRKGHRTPTGVFSVLQMDKDHVSSTYKGAKMPYMERLTWSGIALHAGNLPGYPASHGCIRLPYDFSQLLFKISHLGVVAIVADEHSAPQEVVHPTMFLPAAAAAEVEELTSKVATKTLPPARRHMAGHHPAKVVASIADRKLTIFEDGHIRLVGPLTVSNAGRPIGNHVYVLKSAAAGDSALKWVAMDYGTAGSASSRTGPGTNVLDRLTTDEATAHALHNVMHPGLVLVVTDEPSSDNMRSGRDFVIATHDAPTGWETQVFSNDRG